MSLFETYFVDMVVITVSPCTDSFIPVSARFTPLSDKGFVRKVGGATSHSTTRFGGTVVVEVHGLKVIELVKVGEE
jgi:hypothetical protein